MARYFRKVSMRTRILGGVGVMSFALALSGCDCQTQGCNGPFTAGIATAGVSTAAPVVVLIRPAFSPAVFVDTTPTIDIRIAASTTVDLDQVTIHMRRARDVRSVRPIAGKSEHNRHRDQADRRQ